MRPSLSLTLIAVLANLACGFSSEAGGTFFRTSATRSSPAGRVGAFGGTTTTPFQKRATGTATTTAASKFVSRGGASSSSSRKWLTQNPIDTGSIQCPATSAAAIFGSTWGVGGVLYILAKAIKRVMPIALEPFQSGSIPLSQFELGAYIITCLWFAYVEGYKGFQLKFSPLVVKRSFTLIPGGKNDTKWYHFLLAPMYTMGMIHATKKRKIVSWSVTMGVAAIVAAVKRLPYPWRNIIDAGVVVGLSWGSLSIVVLYFKAWLLGETSKDVDAALPDPQQPKKKTN